MELSRQNVLLFSRSTQHGGTENVIVQLGEILKPEVNSIIVCTADGFDTEWLKRLGVKHYTIPDIESKRPQNMLRVAKIVRRIIEDENITMIHTHHRMAAFYVSLLGLDKKCVFLNTSHNTFYNKKFLTRFAYRQANMIACGNMVKKNLTDYFGFPKQRVRVVHNAIKAFNGDITPEPVIQRFHGDGCFVVGNVGRLSKQKGMRYFIQAIPGILEKHPQTRFLVVGEGDEEAELVKMVKDAQLQDMVVFMGYRNDIQNLMAQMDLVVLSSLWEGLPLTPIEAFSVGKTVVATAVDGTVEIVEDKKSGLLVPPKRGDQIAEKVNWIIEHPEEKRKMELAAQRRFQTEFSFGIFRQGYLECYKKALEART